MREIQIVVLANGLQEVQEALTKHDIAFSRVFDVEAVTRKERGLGHKTVLKNNCCGQGKKVRVEAPKSMLKDKLMEWSYKHISKCLFCAGMRIGIFIGFCLGILSIFIINKW